LMSRQPNVLPTTQDLSSFVIPDDFKTGIPASLLSHRPDIKESELVLRAANARIGVAQANMYPALSINAAGGLNSFQADKWLVLPASLFGNAAGNLLQPIFNKRQLRTQLNVSKIEYEQAVINFKSKLLNAAGEVSDALMQLEKLKEKIEIYNSQNLILQKAVPNSQQLFINGMANYLEIITAQQGLLKNELESADLKRQQITAYIQLYRSLGGGVQ
jgi:multidrug efflux system outer membrane protein